MDLFICHAMHSGSPVHLAQHSRGVSIDGSIRAFFGSQVVPSSRPFLVSTSPFLHLLPCFATRPGASIRSPTAVLKPPHENLASR